MRVRCDDKTQSIWRIRFSSDDSSDPCISAEGLWELRNLLQESERDSGCRILVLEGTNGAFCRGMDLDSVVENPESIAQGGTRLYAECLSLIRNSKKIVIALVDGTVLGGGVGFVAAADMVMATRESRFGLPEVVLGLVPSMVIPVLMDRMPAQKVRRLAMTGVAMDAEAAEAFGLVDWVVDSAERLESLLWSKSRQLLRAAPHAVAQLKGLCEKIEVLPVTEALHEGAQCTASLLQQPEVIGSIQAFLKGESMPWNERPRLKGAS